MTTSAQVLLSKARDRLSDLINSSFIDPEEKMKLDCLDAFGMYEWEPKETLSEKEKVRWLGLLSKGHDNTLESDELTEFLALTAEGGDGHGYFHYINAKALIAEIDAAEGVLESEAGLLEFSLIDEHGSDAKKEVKGAVDTSVNGVALMFDGYSDCCSDDDKGTPVYIQQYDGCLQLIVYADINREDPTHIISLEGARNEKRDEEDL